MPENISEKILYLEKGTREFGREDRNSEEVSDFKKNLETELEKIRDNLIGRVKRLLLKLSKSERYIAYGRVFVLTRLGVKEEAHPYNSKQPYTNRTVEQFVDRATCPDLKIYPGEHNRSIGGTKFLNKKVTELEGKYLNG